MKKQTIFNGILAITLCLLINACNNTEKTSTQTNATTDAIPVNSMMDTTIITDSLKNEETKEANEKEEKNENDDKNDNDDKK